MLLAQLACRPPIVRAIQIESKAFSQPPPIEHMLVVASLENSQVNGTLFDGLHDALTSRLATCGVRPDVISVDPTVLDSEERVTAELKRVQPSVVLMVSLKGSRRNIPQTRWFDLEAFS
jgi:hypothetical protein